MSETIAKNSSDIPATCFAPVYWRAMESQRPDAMIKDEKAVARGAADKHLRGNE